MTYSSEVLADGPVGYWRFGEASGTTAVDASGNGYDGTYANAPTLGVTGALTGDTDKSVTFNGSNQNVSMGNPSAFQITVGAIEVWIKTSTPGASYRGIVVKRGAWGLWVKDGVLTTYDYGTSAERLTSNNIADGAWHHIVLNLDSGVSNGTTLYLDGALVLTTTISVTTHERALAAASNLSPSLQPLAGTLDEVAIYDRALTAIEVQAHYDAGTAVPTIEGTPAAASSASDAEVTAGSVTFAGVLASVASSTLAAVVAATLVISGTPADATSATSATVTTATIQTPGTPAEATSATAATTATATLQTTGIPTEATSATAADAATATIQTSGTPADATSATAAAPTSRNVSTPTPPERTHTVPAESRLTTIAAESRRTTIPAESRITTIGAP